MTEQPIFFKFKIRSSAMLHTGWPGSRGLKQSSCLSLLNISFYKYILLLTGFLNLHNSRRDKCRLMTIGGVQWMTPTRSESH